MSEKKFDLSSERYFLLTIFFLAIFNSSSKDKSFVDFWFSVSCIES